MDLAKRNDVSEIAKLEQRFPCGHRKIDMDNGHGECVFCQYKDEVVAQDAEIAELQQQLAEQHKHHQQRTTEAYNLSKQLQRAREALEFAKVVCTTPLPLKCQICRNGNMGIGFDFCYLNQALREIGGEHE